VIRVTPQAQSILRLREAFGGRMRRRLLYGLFLYVWLVPSALSELARWRRQACVPPVIAGPFWREPREGRACDDAIGRRRRRQRPQATGRLGGDHDQRRVRALPHGLKADAGSALRSRRGRLAIRGETPPINLPWRKFRFRQSSLLRGNGGFRPKLRSFPRRPS
jgi:hypothetical protein